MIFKILVLLFALSAHDTLAATDTVMCYYKSWKDQDVFSIDDIDLEVCTHVNFAFMRMNEDGSFRFDTGGGNETILQLFSTLKSKNPDTKLLITVGGWTEDAKVFSDVAADDEKKSTFASTVLHYITTYNLDGIDIDWEYPGKNGGTPADKQNLVDLITVTRQALNETGGGIITVAIDPEADPSSYDVNALSRLVDGLSVLTYDFHGYATDTVTGNNAALYGSSNDTDTNDNCDAAINSWLNAGADPTKLILGLAFYGHLFALADPTEHGVGAPADGAQEDYTSYNEICTWTDGWTEDWDSNAEVPFKYSESEKQWISYDNAESIGLKVQYAKNRNLRGVMMWAVDDDDYAQLCGEKNVLLQAIKDNL